MKADTETSEPATAARTIGPEDLQRGDYVSVLNEIVEVPLCCWLDPPANRPPEEPIRIRMMACDAGTPLKVQAVCLPFVFVRHADGRTESLDVRRVQLVGINRNYARCVWKEVRKESERHQRQC